MLTLSGSLRVFLALEPCDMRKSFDSLHALVVSHLGEDPRGGAVFAFTNKSRTLIKLLHWDGTGLWIHANSHASLDDYKA
jgi:transposase